MPILVIAMFRSGRSRCSDPGDRDGPTRAEILSPVTKTPTTGEPSLPYADPDNTHQVLKCARDIVSLKQSIDFAQHFGRSVFIEILWRSERKNAYDCYHPKHCERAEQPSARQQTQAFCPTDSADTPARGLRS
jgi:hypothetical protein